MERLFFFFQCLYVLAQYISSPRLPCKRPKVERPLAIKGTQEICGIRGICVTWLYDFVYLNFQI